MGFPQQAVGEMFVHSGGCSGSGHQDMSSGDDVRGVFNGHWGFDFSHDGVDGSVDSEGLAHDLVEEGEFGEDLVGEIFDAAICIHSQDGFLLFEEFFLDVGTGGQTEEDPGGSGGGRVLSSHQQGDHHVGDFHVWDGLSGLVGAVHQVPNHVLLSSSTLFILTILDGLATFLDDGHVSLGHLLLSIISTTVLGEGSPGQHEVDGSEAHVEVVVEVGEGGVEAGSHLFSLEGAGSGVDGQFGEGGREVNGALVGGKPLVGVVFAEELTRLFRDEGDVGLEGRGSQSILDEL